MMAGPYRTALARGFTVIEMITVVAILAILASIAIPSFNSIIEGQRAKNAAVDLYVSLTRARSEALRLNQNVTITPTSGTANWASGWTIPDPLHTGSLLDSHDVVRNLTITGPTSVTYRSSGRTTGTALFTITGSVSSSTRYVCLDLSGRPSINTTGTC